MFSRRNWGAMIGGSNKELLQLKTNLLERIEWNYFI